MRSENADPYQSALCALMAKSERLSLVQIGANDGRVNDPIYNFAMDFRSRTDLLLFEPQANLIPYLKLNYQGHPSAKVVCAGIGPKSTLSLFAVKESAWPLAQPPYAREWPEYRAPTGITSSKFKHVFNWLQAQTGKQDNWVKEMIDEISVDCVRPSSVPSMLPRNRQIDVLQVDCEGMDEALVSMFLNAKILPSIINYEKSRAPGKEAIGLEKELLRSGYKSFDNGRDRFCIRVED